MYNLRLQWEALLSTGIYRSVIKQSPKLRVSGKNIGQTYWRYLTQVHAIIAGCEIMPGLKKPLSPNYSVGLRSC